MANWSAAQQQAGSQVYSGFYGYAIGQGADAASAREFANLGIGTAASEGLNASTQNKSLTGLFGATGDGGNSYGPLQMNVNGLGSGISNIGGNPSGQIDKAAATMWNGAGTDGSYNTAPWFGVGDSYAGRAVGSQALNDSAAAQQHAIDVGSGISNQYGYDASGAVAPVSDSGASNGASYGGGLSTLPTQNGFDQSTSNGGQSGVTTGSDGTLYGGTANANDPANYSDGSNVASDTVSGGSAGNIVSSQVGAMASGGGNASLDAVAPTSGGLGKSAGTAALSSAGAGSSGGASAGSSGGGGAGGYPIQITNAAQVGQNEAASITGMTAGLKADTSALTSAATLISGTLNAGEKNLFTRGTMIVVGLIVLAAGLWLLVSGAVSGDAKGIRMVPV